MEGCDIIYLSNLMLYLKIIIYSSYKVQKNITNILNVLNLECVNDGWGVAVILRMRR